MSAQNKRDAAILERVSRELQEEFARMIERSQTGKLFIAPKMGDSDMLVWRKLSPAKWEEIWLERLAQFANRVSITAIKGARTVRIEVWDLSVKEAKALFEAFGGTTKSVNREAVVQKGQIDRPPIKIRDRLIVIANAAHLEKTQAENPGRSVLAIPPALAFGTGDHATTATCLRLLCDVAENLEPNKWEMLDLGAGTGLIAFAARKLGARSVVAGDFDPAAVRVAKENVKINGLTRVQVRKLDVLDWTPERTYPVVAANIFSEILIKAAPQICKAVASGGSLILSGILRAHEAECLAAFDRKAKWTKRIIRKGKWVTALLQKR